MPRSKYISTRIPKGVDYDFYYPYLDSEYQEYFKWTRKLEDLELDELSVEHAKLKQRFAEVCQEISQYRPYSRVQPEGLTPYPVLELQQRFLSKVLTFSNERRQYLCGVDKHLDYFPTSKKFGWGSKEHPEVVLECSRCRHRKFWTNPDFAATDL